MRQLSKKALKITEILENAQFKVKLKARHKGTPSRQAQIYKEVYEYLDKIREQGAWLYKYTDKYFCILLDKWLGPWDNDTEDAYRYIIGDKDSKTKKPHKEYGEYMTYIYENLPQYAIYQR